MIGIGKSLVSLIEGQPPKSASISVLRSTFFKIEKIDFSFDCMNGFNGM
jgi:hypothetical protein